MVLMCVDAAGRQQAHQVACSARLPQRRDQRGNGRILCQRAIRDRLPDPRQVLHDHAAGADVEVPNFRISHLTRRQPNVQARRT